MSINDITGDTIATKPASDKYRQNHELIWPSKKKKTEVEKLDEKLAGMGATIRGFTPGTDPNATPDQVAAAISSALDQIADAPSEK